VFVVENEDKWVCKDKDTQVYIQ